jgi:hypothetical protein
VKNLRSLFPILTLVLTLGLCAHAQLPAPVPSDPNPWNGTWRLDIKRSSPAAAEEGVPQAYRLKLGPAGPAVVPIQWEIPELGEVVKGYTDGKPMEIRRTHPTPGLTLAVRTEGNSVLLYQVFKNGKLSGAGRMMLVDGGTAWIDLTWPIDRQDLAAELTYVKKISDPKSAVGPG